MAHRLSRFSLCSLLLVCTVSFASNPLPAPSVVAEIDRSAADPQLIFSPSPGIAVDGFNLYRNGAYLNTFRNISSQRPIAVTAVAGDYCLVAFRENEDGSVDYSACSDNLGIGSADLALRNLPEVASGTSTELPGLRAEIYSDTAIELYWDRPSGSGNADYRIERNGALAGTTNGTSFWDDGLSPDSWYDYRVSIAGSGTSVSAASASIRIKAGTREITTSGPVSTAPDTDGPGGTTGPLPPAPASSVSDLRIEYYSPGVAELFWNHAPDVARLAGYNVVIDGETVGVTEGTSFFLTNLLPGDHRIEVNSVARAGHSAGTAVLTIGPSPSPGAALPDAPSEPGSPGSTDSSVRVSSIESQLEVIEGYDSPVRIPVSLERQQADTGARIFLSVEGIDDQPGSSLRLELEQAWLQPGSRRLQTELRVWLPIGRHSLVFHSRRVRISATTEDGSQVLHSTDLSLAIRPVRLADVYLLVGQSNMVGFSELGARENWPGGLDEPVDRIRQLNVTSNNQIFYPNFSAYRDPATIVGSPRLITAEDPLHELRYPGQVNKGGTFVGAGLSFAKSLLDDTTQEIILVPAAWSGTGFCKSGVETRGWQAFGGDGNLLGGVFAGGELAERAIARLNLALSESGGIFRGILWHQGEQDSNNAECAGRYQENLQQLVARLRSDARVDARGPAARHANADIPFVVGTMSKGADSRGNYAWFNSYKRQVDAVHRNISNYVSYSGVVNADDLLPPAYPCGTSSCVHFGAAALREMGRRYADALKQVWNY